MEENKNIFLHLIKSINRDNANIDGLEEFLVKSDFFYAPASTKYHLNIEGGLVEHSLNVYFNLKLLNSIKFQNLDEDSMKIVALCHDFAKINLYKPYVKNEKFYHEAGSNKDFLGKFDWVSSVQYSRNEDSIMLGSHGETSEYITRCYIPLKAEETVAIINHHGTVDTAPSTEMSKLYNKYPLALLLHLADMTSCYIDERI